MSTDPKHSPEAGLPEDRPVPRPEDYIGKMVEPDLQVGSIVAIGSKFVVFKLRNLRTGKNDEVMKVWKVEFDPRTPLLEALPKAMEELRDNPDRVIRICDRLLALDSSMAAAAFDKGVALLVKDQPSAALQAFNQAIALEPADVTNLLHRAACFATLGRHDDMLRDLSTAADLNDLLLKDVLLSAPAIAEKIRESLLRLSKNCHTRQMLRLYFGAGR